MTQRVPTSPLGSLADGFLRSVQRFADRPALEVAGGCLTYADLFERAASLAATLGRDQAARQPPLTAVFAYRSSTAFAGVLGALLHGHGYVPLNRTFPPERTRAMLQRSGCRSLVVDAESEKQLDHILSGIEDETLVILPERDEVQDLATRWPKHRFIGKSELASPKEWNPAGTAPDSIAYLLFTSGSTGVPKGVMVTHRNVRHYVDFMTERFSIDHEDRLSQTFDMTFDLSVADMFVAWERGACVCCPSEKTLINPGRFINDARLTVWFSVPSTAVFMKRLGSLKAGTYPGLRVSMFCGEALPVEVAKAWSEAAPNSVLENIYGPTELTIACTYYRWDAARSPLESAGGLVPIGEPFPGMLPLVVDESLAEVSPGEEGELLMTGPQLSLGYWRDPAKTAAAFVVPPGRAETFYRTGDRVRRPAESGPLLYVGRVDNQIKILGHRVELGEVEAVVREESGVDAVVALGWPRTAGGAGGVEAFLQGERPSQSDLKERVAKRLPVYMTPRRYHYLAEFPLNVNGKYDRHALLKQLETLS
jgi:amino acid adenylation domain-containing protein